MKERMKRFLATPAIVSAGLLASLTLPATTYAQDAASLQVGIMDFNAWRKSGNHPAGVQGEYRFANRFRWGLQPMLGAFANTEGAGYAYGGIYRDFHPINALTVSPNFALGAYHPGNSKNLGGPLEFQTGIDFYTPVGLADRVGLSVRHISNAHIYHHNPGTENVILFYSHALGR